MESLTLSDYFSGNYSDSSDQKQSSESQTKLYVRKLIFALEIETSKQIEKEI